MDVTVMLDEINLHGFEDTDPDQKIRALNDALYDMASRHAWPFLETEVLLDFDGTAAAPTNMPTDFRAARVLRYSPSGGASRALSHVRYDDLLDRGIDPAEAGEPSQYYFVGNELRVYPVPPAGTGVVRLLYFRRPAAVADATLEENIDWPIDHQRLMVLGALQRLYDMEDDPELADRASQTYEARLGTMVADVFFRQYDRPDHIMTDPWFDADDYF